MGLSIVTCLLLATANVLIAVHTGNSFLLVPAGICVGIAMSAALYERTTAPTVEPIQD